MSSAVFKKDVSAYQRWELASFGETRPSHIAAAQVQSTPVVTVPLISQEEIDQIRENARNEGYAAGYQEAYENGLREGQAAGLQAAEDTMKLEIQSMQDLARNFILEIDAAGKSTGQELLDLAISLAENMLKTKLALDHNAILPIVEEAIAQLPSIQQPANILLNPIDATTIKNTMGEVLNSDGWRIVSDAQLSRGDCKIETAYNLVDASIETRWNRLTEFLHSNTIGSE
ncbi:flagellar assembly protein FliH [Undibacterium sp. SXout11W]|uniref:flagellar assembly protein FliH n=1 Tax=Undibacterium sp. SXout11W TaxID=3413050 RepID=UPI003BF2E544